MGDALRPSKEQFHQILQESFEIWSSYLDPGNEDLPLSMQSMDLKSLMGQTPPFLGDGLLDGASFACEARHPNQNGGSLFVNCQSTWKTSSGACDTKPRVLSERLLLAVNSRLSVSLSDDAPFSNWPGIQEVDDPDTGSYLSVLFLAWAYILSARWSELLNRSADHQCRVSYAPEDSLPQSNDQPTAVIYIGEYSSEEEAYWWHAILRADGGWDATTSWNDHSYLSPWSVTAKNARLTLSTQPFSLDLKPEPPSSQTAIKYLARFCEHHRIYGQTSIALTGALYVPFLAGRTIKLPLPEQGSRSRAPGGFTAPIPDIFAEHDESLSKYMTLSTDVWGLRSLLYSTFFNPDIECNLVSAWLNPAFAIIDSISGSKRGLAAFLANREPRLGILWLGAIFTDLATSTLRAVRRGMAALSLSASVWTGIPQTFLTSTVGTSDGDSISRDDECRLLFITAHETHDRQPIRYTNYVRQIYQFSSMLNVVFIASNMTRGSGC